MRQNSHSQPYRCDRGALSAAPHPSRLHFLNRVHAKGVVLCERTCFCLLSTFQAPSIKCSLLRTLRRTLSLLKPVQAPSKNPSKKHLLLKNLLRTLLRSVLLHDTLGVHPTQENRGAFQEGRRRWEGGKQERGHTKMSVGLLYGAGAETLILVPGTSGNILSPGRKPKSAVYTQKTK